MEGSNAQSFQINNEALRKIQAEGVSADQGAVTIDYFGHSCMKITSSKGISMLIDPWRNDAAWGMWFPQEFPAVEVDIALSTHAHFDHDAVHIPKTRMTMERPIGTFCLGDVRITGLGDKHVSDSHGKTRWTELQKDFSEDFSPPNNNLHMDNCIIVVECGGKTLVHWGDNRAKPDAYVDAFLQDINIDVLFLPVDESEHILLYSEADEILKRYKPAITIPMHYYVKGANTVISTLQSIEPWLGMHENVEKLASSQFVLQSSENAYNGEKIVCFGNHFTRGDA